MRLGAQVAPSLPSGFLQLTHRSVDEAAPVIATIPAVDEEVRSYVHLLLLELLRYQPDSMIVADSTALVNNA